jgi:predicted hydrolase (HD superfamily)
MAETTPTYANPRAAAGWSLVCRYVRAAGLRRHMVAVAAAMRCYAGRLNQDADEWEAVGLIHDFDWEIHPDLDRHPLAGAPILRAEGWDEETIRAILSHNTEATGVERTQAIDFALLACDEVTGLIIATTLVGPSKNIANVELRSVRKKWKDRAFAAGVDREHVAQVTADFSAACFGGALELWDHIGNVLVAMQADAARLEMDGRLAE